MKKLLVLTLILGLLVFSCAAENADFPPEDWFFIGYTYGGVTFPVPRDTQFYELTPQEQAMGIIVLCFNDDYMLQLRGFAPEALTWESYREKVLAEETALVSYLDEKESILCVQNTAPDANTELVGIALNGLDGNLYKVSIFTGADEDFSPDAAVWEIAQTVAAYTSQMDFSTWPLQDAAE